MRRKIKKSYGERDCPFFRLRSKDRLAKLLFVGSEKIRFLAASDNLYFEFKKPKRSGGHRQILAPRTDLKQVQKRIAVLLQRITPPNYLFAPVTGRSYVDNAAAHLGASSIRLLDIEDFFPSCTANRVIWLFHKRLECSPDVSAILRGIVTHNGALPQGSPCSPILAYLCYIDMWEEISRMVQEAGCKLSVYADDLTISGNVVREELIWRVKKKLRRYGHRYQASKERKKHLRPAEITGVVLRPDGLYAPNRLHKGLREVRNSLKKTKSSKEVEFLQVKIRGRKAQMNQIFCQNHNGIVMDTVMKHNKS